MKSLIRDFIIAAVLIVAVVAFRPVQKSYNGRAVSGGEVVLQPASTVRIRELVVPLNPDTGKASKYYSYNDLESTSSEFTRWQAQLDANFEERDGRYVCVGAICTVSVFDTIYYKKDVDVTWSGNTVTCKLTMGKRLYFIPLESKEYEFTFTCAPDGTVS